MLLVCSQTSCGYCFLGPINGAGRVNESQQIRIWSVRCCQELPAPAVGALVSIWCCAKPDSLAAVCTVSGWKTWTLCASPKMLEVMSKNKMEKYLLRDLAGPADSALIALLPGGSPDPDKCSKDPTATHKSLFSSLISPEPCRRQAISTGDFWCCGQSGLHCHVQGR